MSIEQVYFFSSPRVIVAISETCTCRQPTQLTQARLPTIFPHSYISVGEVAIVNGLVDGGPSSVAVSKYPPSTVQLCESLKLTDKRWRRASKAHFPAHCAVQYMYI